MIVISDTTPIISFLKMDRLDVLQKLFGKVLIPEAVYAELTTDPRFSDEAQKIREKEYICVEPVHSKDSVLLLKRATGLDQGESEAIILTDELQADLLLMDEAKGRTVSNQMGIRIMGTIGVLIAAFEENIVTAEEVRNCITRLQDAGRHIGQKQYQIIEDKINKK